MTRRDIIRQLSNRTGLSQFQSTRALEAMIAIAGDALAGGDAIFLRGFGTLKTVQRAAKNGRDILRGTLINIPACKQAKFIACNELKARINHKLED